MLVITAVFILGSEGTCVCNFWKLGTGNNKQNLVDWHKQTTLHFFLEVYRSFFSFSFKYSTIKLNHNTQRLPPPPSLQTFPYIHFICLSIRLFIYLFLSRAGYPRKALLYSPLFASGRTHIQIISLSFYFIF